MTVDIEPNGITVTPDGDVYFSDSGHWGQGDGAIFHVDNSSTTTELVSAGLQYPNGCLWADGKLYVVESGTHQVLEVPLERDSDGVNAIRVAHTLPPSFPDGLVEMPDGRLLVGCYRPDRIYVCEDSRVSVLLEDSVGIVMPSPTGLALAGRARDRLLIAAYGGTTVLAYQLCSPASAC